MHLRLRRKTTSPPTGHSSLIWGSTMIGSVPQGSGRGSSLIICATTAPRCSLLPGVVVPRRVVLHRPVPVVGMKRHRVVGRKLEHRKHQLIWQAGAEYQVSRSGATHTQFRSSDSRSRRRTKPWHVEVGLLRVAAKLFQNGADVPLRLAMMDERRLQAAEKIAYCSTGSRIVLFPDPGVQTRPGSFPARTRQNPIRPGAVCRRAAVLSRPVRAARRRSLLRR